jgi:hypothetical protein
LLRDEIFEHAAQVSAMVEWFIAMKQASTIEVLDDGSQLVEGRFGFILIGCPEHPALQKPVCQFRAYSTIWKAVRR